MRVDSPGQRQRVRRRGHRRWPEPELLTPRSSKKSWGKLLRENPGNDPILDAKGCEFKRVRAHRAMRFFHDQLSHAKGERARTRFWLERWEQAVIANLFGWVDRRGRRCYLYLLLYVRSVRRSKMHGPTIHASPRPVSWQGRGPVRSLRPKPAACIGREEVASRHRLSGFSGLRHARNLSRQGPLRRLGVSADSG